MQGRWERGRPSSSYKNMNSVAPVEKNNADVIGEKSKPVTACRTIVSAVVDGSFSMIPIWKNTVEGHRLFLDEQKQLNGAAVYSLRVFDTMQQIIYDFVSASEATTIPSDVYPRGSSALHDSVCLQIERIDNYKKEHPEFTQVVLLIMTDGEDNMSRRFDRPQLNSTVAKCVQDGWQVILMGTTKDVFQAGSKMGIKDIVQYDNKSADAAYKYAARSAHLHRCDNSNV